MSREVEFFPIGRCAREHRVDRRLHFLERLITSGRNLQTAGAVDQDERRIANDVAIEVGNVSGNCQQGITHGNLLHEFLLCVGILCRQSKNYQPLLLALLIEMVERRHLCAAGWTPRCPQTDEQHFALLISETLRLAGDVRGIEQRGGHIVHAQIADLLVANDAVGDRVPCQTDGEHCECNSCFGRSREWPRLLAEQDEDDDERDCHYDRRGGQANDPIFLVIVAQQGEGGVNQRVADQRQ